VHVDPWSFPRHLLSACSKVIFDGEEKEYGPNPDGSDDRKRSKRIASEPLRIREKTGSKIGRSKKTARAGGGKKPFIRRRNHLSSR